MKLNGIIALVFLSMMATLNSCKSGKGLGDINFFSVEQDAELGKQVSAEIDNNPKDYPVLEEKGNEEVYGYIRGLSTKILNTGTVKNKDKFSWQVKIIHDDKTLNAFCTPGGYIYVYTGLIKYLDSEDQLIGVMGHEMGHADRRHSTRQLTKVMGVSILLDLITITDQQHKTDLAKQIAATLVSLKFSREHEKEADEQSVVYLCGTEYNAAGAAGFFKKLEAEKAAGKQQGNDKFWSFLSTHPDPGDRIQNLEASAQVKGCSGKLTNQKEYARIKKLLPK